MTTIVVLVSNYSPYHLARVDAFQQECRSEGWQFVGIELTRSGIAYDWETQLQDFSGTIFSLIGNQELYEVKFSHLVTRLYALLAKINPDAIAIAGYARYIMLAALAWSLWRHRSAILLSESKADDAPRNLLSETLKSLIIKRYAAALVGGKSHQRYLVKLGMNPQAIFLGYNVVGNDIFSPHNLKLLPSPFQKPFFLTINRFIPKKNLLLLISAYADYQQQTASASWDLVLCGSGELQSLIEQKIAALNLQTSVHLPGFLQQQELLPYFAHASCFIHASTQEQWGLVVNEAMAAGLPVLVSNCCGCFEELVIEGVNGFGFDPNNQQQLTNLMLKISSGTINLQKMGNASLERIQKFSPEYFGRGLKQAVRYALADP